MLYLTTSPDRKRKSEGSRELSSKGEKKEPTIKTTDRISDVFEQTKGLWKNSKVVQGM